MPILKLQIHASLIEKVVHNEEERFLRYTGPRLVLFEEEPNW